MSLRSEWGFEYTAKALAQAAEAQRDFREGRIGIWEQKKQEVMAKVKESGLTVHESVADLLSNSGKYGSTAALAGHGATVMVDATLQKDLNECVQKIRHHTEMRNQYNAWAQILNANPESRLKLDHDDWMFFFGK